MTLATLQREFLDSILGGDSASGRLAIYRGNVRAARSGALAATHPVVRRLVGAPFFDEAARLFGRTVDSTSGDLAEYGREFSGFLSAYPHAQGLDYLADVARLEWACHECELAAEPRAFDFQSLARVPQELVGGVRFALAPAVRLVTSPHPVVSIWEANQPGCDGTPRSAAGPEHALVWRDENGVRVERIAKAEWEGLAALGRGETLAQVSAFLTPGLARYVRDGIIDGFSAPGETA